MPVVKFRSIEEMNAAGPGVVDERTAAGVERFFRHCARYWRLAPRVYPRGVFRFRAIEDAQAARTPATMALPGDALIPDDALTPDP